MNSNTPASMSSSSSSPQKKRKFAAVENFQKNARESQGNIPNPSRLSLQFSPAVARRLSKNNEASVSSAEDELENEPNPRNNDEEHENIDGEDLALEQQPNNVVSPELDLKRRFSEMNNQSSSSRLPNLNNNGSHDEEDADDEEDSADERESQSQKDQPQLMMSRNRQQLEDLRMNDDELEKLQKRMNDEGNRKKGRDSMYLLRDGAFVTTATFPQENADDDQQNQSQNSSSTSLPIILINRPQVVKKILTKDELNVMYSSTMKLATEGKINSKNTWDLKLLDYLDEVIPNSSKGTGNFAEDPFVVASSALEAGMKIYSSRVDSVYSNIKQFMNGLSRQNRIQEDDVRRKKNKEKDANAQTQNDGSQSARRKKGVNFGVRTIEKDVSKLNFKKMEREYHLEPLFFSSDPNSNKTMFIGSGNTNSLLQNNLDLDFNSCFLINPNSKSDNPSVFLVENEKLKKFATFFDGISTKTAKSNENQQQGQNEDEEMFEVAANIMPEPDNDEEIEENNENNGKQMQINEKQNKEVNNKPQENEILESNTIDSSPQIPISIATNDNNAQIPTENAVIPPQNTNESPNHNHSDNNDDFDDGGDAFIPGDFGTDFDDEGGLFAQFPVPASEVNDENSNLPAGSSNSNDNELDMHKKIIENEKKKLQASSSTANNMQMESLLNSNQNSNNILVSAQDNLNFDDEYHYFDPTKFSSSNFWSGRNIWTRNAHRTNKNRKKNDSSSEEEENENENNAETETTEQTKKGKAKPKKKTKKTAKKTSSSDLIDFKDKNFEKEFEKNYPIETKKKNWSKFTISEKARKAKEDKDAASKKKFLLPEDVHYDPKKFSQPFCMKKFIIKPKPKKALSISPVSDENSAPDPNPNEATVQNQDPLNQSGMNDPEMIAAMNFEKQQQIENEQNNNNPENNFNFNQNDDDGDDFIPNDDGFGAFGNFGVDSDDENENNNQIPQNNTGIEISKAQQQIEIQKNEQNPENAEAGQENANVLTNAPENVESALEKNKKKEENSLNKKFLAAKMAQRVNVKKLKSQIWKEMLSEKSNLEKQAENLDEEDEVPEKDNGISLKKLVKNLKTKNLTKSVGENVTNEHVSVPYYFMCILHLANEKELAIKTKKSNSESTSSSSKKRKSDANELAREIDDCNIYFPSDQTKLKEREMEQEHEIDEDDDDDDDDDDEDN